MVDSWISCRAYAKRRGVSAMAVSEAIKNGRLVKSVTRDENGLPKIADPDLADAEWEANTDVSKRIAAAGGVVESSPRVVTVNATDVEVLGDALGPIDTIATATQREKHWKANLAELKFKEAAGELVPAKDVERRFVDVFTQCKTRLLSIPSRARQALPHLVPGDLVVLEGLLREAIEDLQESPDRSDE